MEGMKEGHYSSPPPLPPFALPPFPLMSHSAVFKVNIFTAPLITRTSGTALPTSPTPSHREIKYSYALPSSPSTSLHYPVCLTSTSCHFYSCHSHSCFFYPLTFHISILQLPYVCSLSVWHTLRTSVKVCVSCMGRTSHAVNTSGGSDMYSPFSHVYFSIGSWLR